MVGLYNWEYQYQTGSWVSYASLLLRSSKKQTNKQKQKHSNYFTVVITGNFFFGV